MNMIRNLAGLIIILALLPICMLAFRYTANLEFEYDEVNDELSLCQLRETLLISYDMEYAYDELRFRYCNNDFRLSMVNNRLLLQPGTQIYLNNVDELHFERMNGCIYVCYQKGNDHYERILCREEGFYLREFSDCDVRDAEHNSSEERLYPESGSGISESE